MGMPGFGRQHGNNRRPVHTWDGLQDKFGDCHEGAGISCTDAGIGLAILDEINGDSHGGVLFAAKRLGGRLVHFNDFRCMNNTNPIAIRLVSAGESFTQ